MNCQKLAAHCGDGIKNGNEYCDLGKKNGEYGSGCSWDCKDAGPRCGDSTVQSNEQCDGNSESTSSAIGTLGACVKDSSGYDTQRTSTCSSNCTWGAWGSCAAKGSCGDGVKNGSEECDDGNAINTDACTTSCKNSYCGDGYVYSVKEMCDEGSKNGTACTANYGLTCNYCNYNCTYAAVTGPYCGDGVKNGGEECDGKDYASKTCKDYNLKNPTETALKIEVNGLSCDTSCKINTSKCIK